MSRREIERKLEELKKVASAANLDISGDLSRISAKLRDGESDPNVPQAWRRVELARHTERPSTLEYIRSMADEYVEFHGDRAFGDDQALVGGICTIDGIHCTFIGHQKGHNMKENLRRNYGMAHPEGYRKALRLAEQAARFGRPIITFVDTFGAFPGVASEERGISEAIARNLREFSVLPTPIVTVVIGEGGSGGALGIAVADRVYMLENGVYSVISPEGFASILLRDAQRNKEAAALMKITSDDLYRFGLIDGIIREAPGGAHTDPAYTAVLVKKQITSALTELRRMRTDALLRARSERLLGMGALAPASEREGLFGRLRNRR